MKCESAQMQKTKTYKNNKRSAKQQDNMRTVSLRIPGPQESKAAITEIERGYHLRNMIIILLNIAQNSKPELYRLLRQPDIMRSILGDQPGGEKAVLVAKARALIEGSDRALTEMLASCKEAAKDFDIKHVDKIARAIKGEFAGYVTKLGKGEKASKPRARKIRDVSSMALPLDKERVKWVSGGLRITFHKDRKVFFPTHQEKLAKVLDLKSIKS